MSLTELLREKLYHLRLWIGRLERCVKCNKYLWNRTVRLYHSLYHTKSEGQPRNQWNCKGCSLERKQEEWIK